MWRGVRSAVLAGVAIDSYVQKRGVKGAEWHLVEQTLQEHLTMLHRHVSTEVQNGQMAPERMHLKKLLQLGGHVIPMATTFL